MGACGGDAAVPRWPLATPGRPLLPTPVGTPSKVSGNAQQAARTSAVAESLGSARPTADPSLAILGPKRGWTSTAVTRRSSADSRPTSPVPGSKARCRPPPGPAAEPSEASELCGGCNTARGGGAFQRRAADRGGRLCCLYGHGHRAARAAVLEGHGLRRDPRLLRARSADDK